MTHWTENIHFSIAHDDIMARVSGFDDRSQEHWALIKAGKGYGGPEGRRRAALEKIQDSILAGDPPGRIYIDE